MNTPDEAPGARAHGSPAPEQTVLVVSLIVKGTEGRATLEVRERLGAWLREDLMPQDGMGFPLGSLLHYSVKSAEELPKPRGGRVVVRHTDH